MASGIEAAEWGRLSVHLAEMWNTVRDPKKGKPIKPSQFSPYDTKGRLKKNRKPIQPSFERAMKSAFPSLETREK